MKRRFLYFILLLPITADYAIPQAARTPASKSVERRDSHAPLIRRTYLLLTGHAVDLLARKAKFPPELEESLHGNLIFVPNDVYSQLLEIKERFSATLDTTGLSVGGGAELRKLKSDKIIAPVAGNDQNTLTFDNAKIPSDFFETGEWHIDGYNLINWLTGEQDESQSIPRRDVRRSEIQIPDEALDISRYLARDDLAILKKALIRRSPVAGPGMADAVFRFFEYATRNGMPQNLLLIRQAGGCGGGTELTVATPFLQVRVLIVENISSNAVQLGDFDVRRCKPSPGQSAIRNSTENARTLADAALESMPLYKRRVLSPGEKLVIPVELTLRYGRGASSSESDEEDDDGRGGMNDKEQKEAEAALTSNDVLQTISITSKTEERVKGANGEEDYKERLVEIARLSKSQFLAGLKRQEPRVDKATSFVFGPCMEVEAIKVNADKYAIDKYDAKYVLLFSGYGGGSCPVVYSLANGEQWYREGTILTHRGAKHREGTDEIELKHFVGVVKIAEEEDEVSYVDRVYLRMKTTFGASYIIPAREKDIAVSEGRYITLRRGDTVTLRFDIPPDTAVEKIYLGASGYYLSQQTTETNGAVGDAVQAFTVGQ